EESPCPSAQDTLAGLDRPLDPVCGMMVDPATAAGSHEHRGTTYWFCSRSCLERFREDPDRYLGRAAAPPAPTADSILYTCPMHPEVIAHGPGSCPKCGMALEPVMPVIGEEESSELADMTRRFRISAALTLPIFLGSMVEMAGVRLPGGQGRAWVELLLATPVVLWGGWPFFERAARSIRNLSPNMFTLIGLGTGVAYGASLVATVAPGLFPPSFRGHHGEV